MSPAAMCGGATGGTLTKRMGGERGRRPGGCLRTAQLGFNLGHQLRLNATLGTPRTVGNLGLAAGVDAAIPRHALAVQLDALEG